jgi:deoxycytidine triphosphate deaminase
MRDPEADAREYDPKTYWKNPVGEGKTKGLKQAYWADPWPELQGMLTSDHIRAYHEAVGRMIRPFDPDRLRPASYELTLSSSCLVEGRAVTLDDDSPVLSIPPNSIAYVSMQQVLFIPHYLVGRFDLAIEFIYKGLLLGTGPQVDPGFQGALSCPLHNISNEPIEIRLGHPFAKLDFAKTAPRREPIHSALAQAQDEEALAELLGNDAFPWLRLFKGGRHQWRKPIYGYLEGKRPTSSVRALRNDFESLRTKVTGEVDRLRATFTRSGTIAGAGILVTLLLGVPAFVYGAVEGSTSELASESDVVKLQEQARTERRRADALEAEVCRLRKQRPRFC